MPRLAAALVTPLTGPLARYGRATAAALRLWAGRAATLPAPWTGVALAVHDSHPDAAAAMRAVMTAGPEPEVVFGPYGSSPAVAAAGATGRVVWNHGGATSALARPAFTHVVNVPAPASSYFEGALEAVRAADGGARTVTVLHASTGFGRDVGGGARRVAGRLGFDVRVVEFAPGGAASAADGLGGGDVVLVAGAFEDEEAAGPVLLEQRWRAAAFVGAGVSEVLAGLGGRLEGLLGPAQWAAAAAPTPDEGPEAGWFVDAYREAAGDDPPYPAASAFAAGILAARCLRDAGSAEDLAVLDAARRLHCTTLYGRFRLDPRTGLQAGHRVVTVQWQQGVRRGVWPPDRAERPLAYPLA